MAFNRVNGTAAHSGSGASSYATSALSVTAGNLLVVIVRNTNDGGTISSVTDTAGNTFTSIGKQPSVNGGAVWMYYAENVTGNASDVVTVTFSAAQTNCSVVVQQFSGAATSASLRTSTLKQGTGGASSVTSNSFSPTAGDLLVSGLDDEPAGAATSYTQPSGYTLNESRTLFPAGASAYNLSATGGAQTDTWSATGGSGHNLAMISAAFKPSGTIREISGALAAATWTLAGPFSRDHFITNALRALGYTLAGPLNRDTFVGGGANLVFGLSGRPTRPDLLIEQSGRAFDFAIFAPAVALDVEPPPIVHVWGIQVAAPGYIADPNMFYLGVAVGNAPPAPVRGAANLNLFSVFDPGALHFDLTPKGQGLLLDLALNTRLISGTLRAAGFSLAGDGVKVILKNLSGSAGLSHTLAGNPARDAAAVPENGTTPWNPGADASWVNVRDFGATGNGVTDDTTAFRNAANTRKRMYVPAANPGQFYRLTGAVTVYNDVYGDGTMPQIRMTTVSGGSSGREDLYSCFYISGYRGAANVTFNGLYLHGGWDGGSAGEWAHGIAINNCDNIIVKYCRIENMYGDDTWAGGYSGAGCHNIVIRNNDLLNTHRCNSGTNFCDGFYLRDNYIYKQSTYVSAVDIETDNLGTQANHNIYIEGNEWNVATQDFNTGALNFTTWPNDDHTGPATLQASALRNNFGRWTNTLTAYYPPNNPQSPNGLISSPYGYNPIFINASPTKNGAFLAGDTTPRWT